MLHYTPDQFTPLPPDHTLADYERSLNATVAEHAPVTDATGAVYDMPAMEAGKIASGYTPLSVRFDSPEEMRLVADIAGLLSYKGLRDVLSMKWDQFGAALRSGNDEDAEQASVIDSEGARQVLEVAVKFPGTILPKRRDDGSVPEVLVPAKEVKDAVAQDRAVRPSGHRISDLPFTSPMEIRLTDYPVTRQVLSGLGGLGGKASGLLRR